MTIKRYQIALLSFALGIFTVTSLGIYFINKIGEGIITVQDNQIFTEYRTVKIFFSNSAKDPETLYCDRTYPVDRAVSRLSNNQKSALGEYIYLSLVKLLEGPSFYEKEDGFFTSINEGTKVQKIIIENGVANVDFNMRLNEGIAGSCKVQAIRSQITETLKQFPEIKEVVISMNGELEDILQP